MSSEDMQTPLQIAEGILKNDIEQMGHGLGTDVNLFFSRLNHSDLKCTLIKLALCRAVHEMLWTSGVTGLGEEHQTASFMGHLTTNLGWYSLMALSSVSPEEREANLVPDIRWAHQSRTDESITGADFGLMVNLSDSDDPNSIVRLLVFQAKVARPCGDGSCIKIDHPVGRKPKESKPTAPLPRAFLDAIRVHLDDPNTDDAVIRALEAPPEKPHYQLEALLRTNYAGRRLATVRNPWCFYIALHKPRSKENLVSVPAVRSLESIAVDLEEHPDRVSLQPAQDNLIDVMSDALTNDESRFGIQLDLKNVKFLAGTLCELLPNLSLMLVSDSSKGGQALEKNLSNHFSISPSLLSSQTLETGLSLEQKPERAPSLGMGR